MHDYCDLYLKLLDDVDLLFAQYSGGDSYVRKQSTMCDPSYTVKCALNAISAAIRLSRKNHRDLTSLLAQVYYDTSQVYGGATKLLQQLRSYSILGGLYSALERLVPLISGREENDLFEGMAHVCRYRVVRHLEEAVSSIACAARDIQNSVYRKDHAAEGEKYYRHASRAVFTCVRSLLDGQVSCASNSGFTLLSFSGIKAAIKLVLLLSDATPDEYLYTAAHMSLMQFEHCIRQLAKARGLEEWAPQDEHQVALSAFKFAVSAYANSRGKPLASQENSMPRQRFADFHLLEASSYVDYITAKSGVYAYALDAYEEEHDEQHLDVTKVYDSLGEMHDLESAFDKIDALVDGMLPDNRDGVSSSFYSSPAVRSSIKRIADSVAVLLAKVYAWDEAWRTLQGDVGTQNCEPRALALYDVLQKSREDFVVSVGRALELFTICVCRLDDVYYSRSIFPMVAAWDSSSLPVFPGEYTRSVSDAPQNTDTVSENVAYTAGRLHANKAQNSSDGHDKDGIVESHSTKEVGNASDFGDKFAKIMSRLDDLFNKEERFPHGRRALPARSFPIREGAAPSSITASGGEGCAQSPRINNSGSAARAHSVAERTVLLSKVFSEVASSGTMQSCVEELRKALKERKQQHSLGAGLRGIRRGAGSSTGSSNYLTVPEPTYRKRNKKVGFDCDVAVGSGEKGSRSAKCPQIVVTSGTEAASYVVAVSDLQTPPSTRLEVSSSPSRSCASLERGGGDLTCSMELSQRTVTHISLC